MDLAIKGLRVLVTAGANGIGRAGDLAASIMFTNLIMILPLLLVVRRFRPPFGAATLLERAPRQASTAAKTNDSALET